MKKRVTFHLIILVSCFLLLQGNCVAQEKIDAYKIENDGYFIHIASSAKGTVFTDNSGSAIYLIKENKFEKLINSPGCGRYFTVSPDQSKIGFKLIKADGMQVPAVYDFVSEKISELTDTVDLCGQVSFSNDGAVAYTIGNTLNVTKDNNLKTFDLGCYSNIAPISPDGNFVVYNNDNDQLFVLDINNSQSIQITDNNGGYCFPQWSPDGTKILYSSLSGILKVYNCKTKSANTIGKGENASWTNDENIIFNRTETDNFEYKGSDIFISSADGSKILNLTNTTDVNEISPLLIGNNILLYSTFEKREIVSVSFNPTNFSLSNKTILAKSISPLIMMNYSSGFTQKLRKSIVMIQGDAPYVHQKWDTPDWHTGGGSCAPTTAIMALAYYNRLPYWDITCSAPSSHTSHYGSYVADMYRYNGIYYNTVAQTSGGEDAWGGYGYMWGLGSPNSYMATYISNHNVTSVHSDTTTFAGVKAEINHSYPFPICNTLSTAGHLTLTVGYVNGQHTLIFNDPYGDKDTLTWPNYFGKNSYYDWPGYSNGYQNLNSIAWTVTSESTQLTYSDTIIDDVNYNHGFYMYNQSPSHMKYFHDSETGGYGSYTHYWYTTTSASTTVDTCYVKWTPTLPSSGTYELFAYIPTANASVTTARYRVYYNGGNQTVIINQAPIYGAWVSLGTFPFLQGSTGYVRLGDASGIAGQKVAFDAMKWVKIIQTPAAIASFNASNTTVCAGTSVQFTNSSTNATSYNWSMPGAMPSASTSANPLVVYTNSGTYNVQLIATGPGGSDTLSNLNYITVNPLPVAAFSATDTTIYIPGGNAVFANTSTNATSYVWNFGDGQTSIDFQPWHAYALQGDYTITLVAHNALCGSDTMTLTQYIHVIDVTGISLYENNFLEVSLNPNPSDGIINLSLKGIHGNLNLKIFNIEGQLIYYTVIPSDANSYSDVINLKDYKKGMYYLELRNKDIVKVEKIVLY